MRQIIFFTIMVYSLYSNADGGFFGSGYDSSTPNAPVQLYGGGETCQQGYVLMYDASQNKSFCTPGNTDSRNRRPGGDESGSGGSTPITVTNTDNPCAELPNGTNDVKGKTSNGREYSSKVTCKNGKQVNAKDATGDGNGTQAGYNACDSAHTWAQNSCTGQQMSGQMSSLLGSFTSASNTGNMKEACESARQISLLSAAANVGTSLLCKSKAQSCIDTCGSPAADYDDLEPGKTSPSAMLAQCKQMQSTLATSAMAQGVQSASAFMQSKLCMEAASGKCIGDNAYDDPDCTQYCMKAGRQTDPKCQLAISSCSNATYAQQNATYCGCITNPTATGCSGLASIPSPSANSLDLSSGLGGDDYATGYKDIPKSTASNAAAAGNSGYSGGSGGGSYAIPGDGGAKGGTEAVNKDILNGYGGGSAGGFGYGGGGGYTDGGGKSGGGSGGKGGGGLDLRAFLPGGKSDPRRNPASMGLGYADGSITSANGLTNFQKVTRKLNEKRPELMP